MGCTKEGDQAECIVMWRYYLFFLIVMIGPALVKADDWERHLYRAEHGKLPGRGVKKSSGSVGAFRGYGRYDRQFRELCGFMEFDGRRARFQEIMDANSGRDPECAACRPLFKGLSVACRSGSSRSKVSVSDVDDGTAKQREPRVEVLRSLAKVFRDIESDAEIRDLSVPAIKRLIYVLRNNDGYSRAEREYYGYLVGLIERIFAKELYKSSKAKKKKEGPALWHQQEGGLDDFFDG